MKSAFSIIIFSAMILLLMFGMVWEVDYQKFKITRAYRQFLEERALDEWRADPQAQATRKDR